MKKSPAPRTLVPVALEDDEERFYKKQHACTNPPDPPTVCNGLCFRGHVMSTGPVARLANILSHCKTKTHGSALPSPSSAGLLSISSTRGTDAEAASSLTDRLPDDAGDGLDLLNEGSQRCLTFYYLKSCSELSAVVCCDTLRPAAG